MYYGCGALLLLVSSLAGLAYLATAFFTLSDQSFLGLALMVGGMALFTGVAGGSLLALPVVGYSSDLEATRPSPSIALWLLAFGSVLLLGQMVLALGPSVSGFALPPLHFLAAWLPAWLLASRLAWPTRVTRLTYGGCAATSLAIASEAIIAAGVFAGWLVAMWRAPQSRVALEALRQALTQPETAAWDASALAPLLSPMTVAALFIVFGLVGPAVEELAKLLGVAIWRPQTIRQAWLQGLTIGAGFGITEALTLGAAGGSLWPVTMAVRASATLMHAAMAGVAALGWFALVQRRHAAWGMAGIGAAILGHGIWNSLVLGTALAPAMANSPAGRYLAAVSGSGLPMAWSAIALAYVIIDGRTRSGHRQPEVSSTAEMPPSQPPAAGAASPSQGAWYTRQTSEEATMKPVDAAAQNREAALERLLEFLRIPSVSAVQAHGEDVRRAAEWLAQRLQAAGANEVRIDETPGHPVVYARAAGPIEAPQVLVYGHYDVQPAEPLEAWTSPPFEPTVRNGAVYARGASDDKGQLSAYLEALEAFHQTVGGPPVTLLFVIEGEEEIGSPNLTSWLLEHAAELAADVALVSDTSMLAPDRPTLTYGLRGLAYLEIEVHGPAHDLHSGQYGGAVANPANVLCAMIAALHDSQGRVAIPGFYDAVRPLTAEERAALASVPFDKTVFRKAAGEAGGYGEAGYTDVERLWARPTLDVNGLVAGWTGEGAKTVLPKVARAKISMRLVPDQDPASIGRITREHLERIAPPGVRLTVRELQGAAPVIVDRDLPAVRAAAQALEQAFGQPAAFAREGGTVPVVATLQALLGVPPVLIGFGLPDDHAHGPDEKFGLDQLARGTAAIIHLLERLATAAS